MFLSVLILIHAYAEGIIAHHGAPARRACYLRDAGVISISSDISITSWFFLVRRSRAACDARARTLHVTG
jgi:hypothetical protein